VYLLAVMGGALPLASLIAVSHWLSFDWRQLMKSLLFSHYSTVLRYGMTSRWSCTVHHYEVMTLYCEAKLEQIC